mgnify:CR=1 FL=1
MTLYGDDNKDEKKPFMQHRQKVRGKNFVESEEAGGTKASKVKILFYGKSSDEFKC